MRVGPTAGEQPAETIEKEGGIGSKETVRRKKAHAMEFLTYFSEWRHAKHLVGTCGCWFLLDIAWVWTDPSVYCSLVMTKQVLWHQLESDCRSAADPLRRR